MNEGATVSAATIYRRMGIALLALVGLMIAIYLSLYRLGILGTLLCGVAGKGCETVQLSEWSKLAGIPVVYIGVVAYTALLSTALAGTRPRFFEDRGVSTTLFALGCCAAAFATYNTSVEVFFIHAFCPWCVTCAGCAFSIFLLGLPERRLRRGGAVVRGHGERAAPVGVQGVPGKQIVFTQRITRGN